MPPPVTARVTWLAPTDDVLYSIDEPTGSVESDALSFVCAGWVWARTGEIGAVEIRAGADQLRWSRLTPRAGVTEHLASQGIDTGGKGTSFYLRVGVVGLPEETDVVVRGQRAEGEGVDLAVIHVTRSRRPPAFRTSFEPILVLSTGRSGSTWLMDLLGRHRSIVVNGQHPYELRAAHYWMHFVRSLSQGPISGEPPETFIERPTVTPFPYAIPGTAAADFASTPAHVRELVKYALNATDGFYGTVARQLRKPDAGYFAEKAWFGQLMPGVFNEVYPRTRNVFIIRDPRDAVASVLAFNQTRGWDDFGRARVASDEEYAADFTRYVMRGLTMSESLPTSLVLRYEDLVREPAEALRRVLEYCELDSDQATIAGVIRTAEHAGSIPAEHRTSASTADSIGRWRRELTPTVRETIESTMGDTLARVGYERSR